PRKQPPSLLNRDSFLQTIIETWRTRVGHVSTIHTSGWMGLPGTVIVISSSQKTQSLVSFVALARVF
ncbi:hypothetical protein MUK42_19571, partial [Musa troglodytarum]